MLMTPFLGKKRSQNARNVMSSARYRPANGPSAPAGGVCWWRKAWHPVMLAPVGKFSPAF